MFVSGVVVCCWCHWESRPQKGGGIAQVWATWPEGASAPNGTVMCRGHGVPEIAELLTSHLGRVPSRVTSHEGRVRVESRVTEITAQVESSHESQGSRVESSRVTQSCRVMPESDIMFNIH